MPKSTYSQIRKQIAALEAEAERLLRDEKAGVIARIKEAISSYAITADELFASKAGRGARKGAKANAGAAFSDGNGNSWSGRGPRPKWLRTALESGRSIDEFRIGAAASKPRQAAAKRAGKAGRKGGSSRIAVKFRDGAGNTWTGRGSQPRWLRAALEGGKKISDFAV